MASVLIPVTLYKYRWLQTSGTPRRVVLQQVGHAEAQNFLVPIKMVSLTTRPTISRHLVPLSLLLKGNPLVMLFVVTYGDAEQIVQSEGPTFQRPTQTGQYFGAPDIDPKLDKPAFLATPGPGSEMSTPREMSPPRGMNTGMSGFGSGPRRNEQKPAEKA